MGVARGTSDAPATARSGDTTARPARPRTSAVAARTWPSALAGLVALAGVAWLATHAGGYFPSDLLPVGAAAFAAVAVVLALRPPLFRITGRALAALGALGGLCGWTALSTRWSLDVPAGTEDAQRTLTYAGLFGLGLLAAGSGRLAGLLVRGALCVGLGVLAVGLVERLLPGAVEDAPALGYRLSGPLTYWNAYGALGAVCAVLAAGLAAAPEGRPALRGAWAAGAVLAAVALELSLSRGAWLALGVGLVVLLAASRARGGLLVTLALVTTLVTVAVLRLADLPALVDDPTLGSGQVDAGRVLWPQLLGLALLAAGLQWLVALAGPRAVGWRTARLRAGARRLVPWCAGAAALLALAGYGVASARVDGVSARIAERATGWAGTQWHELLEPAPTALTGTRRLTTARGTRADIYRVALEAGREHPLAGDGAGSFRVRWAHDRRVDEEVRNAHSLYLETFADTGAVGLALLLVLLGAIAAGAWWSVRRVGALTRAEAAAVSAACAVWAAHAAIDWDWQVPALTGLVLLLAATLCPPGRRARTPASRSTRRAGVGALAWRGGALAALAVAVLLGAQARDAREVRAAAAALGEGDVAAASAQASGARSAPARVQARLVAAYAAQGLGDRAAAEGDFAAAAAASPNDWAIRADRGQNLLALGRRAAARAELARARELNPHLQPAADAPG